MHRAILLVLLGIPILLIMQVALSGEPVPGVDQMFLPDPQAAVQLKGHWRPADQPLVTKFVLERSDRQGS